MSKRVLLVVVVTLAALVGAMVWVPVEHGTNYKLEEFGPKQYVRIVQGWGTYHNEYINRWCFIWNLRTHVFGRPPERPLPDAVEPPDAWTYNGERVLWPIVFAEQALLLLLGGGLLTWVVRREALRRAASDAPAE